MLVLLDDSPERLSAMREAVAGWQPGYEVRTFDNASEMIEWLGGHLRDCALISLDHDLGPSRDVGGERRDPGTGRDVADFLARQAPACPIIIHTSNNLARVGMELALKEAGWKVLRAYPGPDLSWVSTSWLGAVREALGQHADYAIYKPGADLVAPISSGDASLLAKFFAVRTAGWKYPMQHCECYTIGLFDDLVEALSPSTAFALVPAAAAIVLEQSDPELLETASALLLDLVTKSDTTEMLPGFASAWPGICRAFSAVGSGHSIYFDGLRTWYRLPRQAT